jgi:uncharacterized protein with WD repeat
MVSAIGATTLAQAPALRAASSKTQTAADTTAPAASAADDAGTDAASVPSAQAAAVKRVGDQLDAQFGAARVQRAQDDASPAAAEGSAVDYIAEADTNKDRKVSEQERIAYAKKQASEAQQANKAPDAAQQSRAQEAQQSRAQEMQQEAQQAYLPQETPGSRLDTSA